jgi:hypothetical protein
MDRPAWAALYVEFGGVAVSLAVADLGYEEIPEEPAESDALAEIVRDYLSGAMGV